MLLCCALVGSGCGSAPRPVIDRDPVPGDLRPYLVTPELGYPLALSPGVGAVLGSGYREGILAARADLARGAATELLARDPALAPALVLQAQAALLERSYREAVEWAARAAEPHSGYVAAQLALGRGSEELGEIARAHAAFAAVAGDSALAASRAAELAPRVGEILVVRTRDALGRGRAELAHQSLRELQLLEPGSRRALELAVEVYHAAASPRQELEALTVLLERVPADPQLRERRAVLEVEVGDPATGLAILEALQAEMPTRTDLGPRIDRAKYFWRLRNLPGEVQELLSKPELTRGDFAVLLYWLVPSVRSAVAQEARIATDVLDHPQRQRIVRVVNLGLMDLEPGVRRFDPDRPIRRSTALVGILRLLGRQTPAPACVNDWSSIPHASQEATCQSATACEILPEVSECLPAAPLSAATALEWLRILTSY